MFAITMALTTLSSCEDVPAPYDDPNSQERTQPEIDENVIVEESFASGFGSFTVHTVEGTPWTISYSTATGTGYNSSAKTNTMSESYLVSDEIDLTGITEAYITFQYIYRYRSNDGNDLVLITGDYTDDPVTTTWTDITGKLTEGSNWDTFYTFAQAIPEQFLNRSGVRIALYYSSSETSSRTWEVKQLQVRKGVPETEPEPELPAGGTLDNPWDVATALQVVPIVGESGTTDNVYVKGKIAEVTEISTSNGNATFLISDDGSKGATLTIYRTKGLENENITDDDYVKVGDDVVICGRLVNFKGNTPEITQGGYIHSLNGKTTSGSGVIADPTGSGTLEDPYNVAAAQNFIKSLAADTPSDDIYVKGIISKIKEVDTSEQFGNATYWISDDGTSTNQLQVFRGYYLKNEKFTNADAIKVGDEVIVCGKATNFKGTTPEFADKANYIYSINGDNGEPKTAGTHNAPISVSEAIAFGNADHAWVKGTVVGVIDTNDQLHFDYDEAMANSTLPILLYDNLMNTYESALCLVAQLNRSMRSYLHPANQNLGRNVVVYGTLGDYNGRRGLSNITYAEVETPNGTITIGTPPEE